MSTTMDPRVERTRRVVLEATAELLAEEGFERITIDGIAERSGVARSTIYRNWPDRAQLLIDAFSVLCDFEPTADTGSLEGDLRSVGQGLAAGLTGEAWGRTLPSLIGAAAHDEELRDAQRTFNAQRRTLVRAVVQRAVDRGEVADGADVDLAITRFAATFFFTRLFTQEPIDDAFVDRVVTVTVAELQRG